MKPLTDAEKSLIRDAQFFVYYVVFKEDRFHPSHNLARFTFEQFITATREGFDYIDEYGERKSINFRNIDVFRIWRIGLPDYATISEIPELKLLLDSPDTIFPWLD